MIRTLLKPLSFLPAILLMYMIFSFSSQTGDVSSDLSLRASAKIVRTADYVFDAGLEEWQIQEYAEKINFITRKLAHMTEYFALAIAVSFPLYVYGMHGFLLMLVAGFLCVAFACGDEYHQSFVSGRSPAMRDVCIDSFGVFWGIILVRIIGWTGRKTIFRPRKKKQKMKEPACQAPAQKNPYQGAPKNVPYQNVPYQNTPQMQNFYQNAPYQGAPQMQNFYPNGPYQNAPQMQNSYPNGPYQNAPQMQNSYPNGPYQNTPQMQNSYQNPPYQNVPSDVPHQTSQGTAPESAPISASGHRARRKREKEKDWFFDL